MRKATILAVAMAACLLGSAADARPPWAGGGRGQSAQQPEDAQGEPSGPGDQRPSGWCPPGLAKKNNGCMPPGQARRAQQQQQQPQPPAQAQAQAPMAPAAPAQPGFAQPGYPQPGYPYPYPYPHPQAVAPAPAQPVGNDTALGRAANALQGAAQVQNALQGR